MKLRLGLAILLLLSLPALAKAQSGDNRLFLPLVSRGLSAPQLKWAYGGCYNSWCETGWYSSPAVANIDGEAIDEADKDAVGQALGANPFAPVVPCHRVLGAQTGTGGFSAHGGLIHRAGAPGQGLGWLTSTETAQPKLWLPKGEAG